MEGFLQQLWGTLREATTVYLPKVVGALAILIGFWILALLLAAVVRGALRRTQLDDRIFRWVTGKEGEAAVESERWVSRGVFYLVMLFGVIAFFKVLGLLVVAEPINRMLQSVFEYAPRILSAALLVLVAWLTATLVRMVVSRGLAAVRIDERLGEPVRVEEGKVVSVAQTVSSALYWLVFLLFLPMVLEALALQGMLEPLQAMLSRVLGFLPNLFAAALILFFGWLAARIVRQVLTNVLATAGLDRVGERAGVEKALGKHNLSGLIGMLAYVLILIPVLIGALDALNLGRVSEPAGQMLSTILQAIPSVLTAGLILGIAYVVGRIVSGLVTDLLTRIGFNNVLRVLGISKEPPGPGQPMPSEIAGFLVLVATLFFASIEAARWLGLAALAALLVSFTEFAGHVLLGLAVLGVGLWVANVVAEVIRSTRPQARGFLASAARIAIVVLAGFMALREMGIAETIIDYAFLMLLGAVAVSVALAFGLGGREIAAREVEGWVRNLKG